MHDLTVRDLPDQQWQTLQSLASAEGVPVEEKARRLLAHALSLPAGALADAGGALRQLERFRQSLTLPPGTPDSVQLLREDRGR
jgi:plasmid stability protein